MTPKELHLIIQEAVTGQEILLPPGEYQGPLIIEKPLRLVGQGAYPEAVTIWTAVGPAIIIRSSEVTLTHLGVILASPEARQRDVTVGYAAGCKPKLVKVAIEGRLADMGALHHSQGWDLPEVIHLGELQENHPAKMQLMIEVPDTAKVQSELTGLRVLPNILSQKGRHSIELELTQNSLKRGTILAGQLVIQTNNQRRAVWVIGRVVSEIEFALSQLRVKPNNLAWKKIVSWEYHEPPADLSDRVPHEETLRLRAKNGWHLIGASRRGKMHEHNGSFREDAFALAATENDWHIMVVADGDDGCTLSRVGSNLAANTAVKVMQEKVIQVGDFAKLSEAEIKQFCEKTLQDGMKEAWFALELESISRKVEFKEFGTTFLALMHYCNEDKHIVGVLQIGNGLVATQDINGKVDTLTDPDSNAPLFLTSKRWDAWLDRVKVQTLGTPPQLIAAMSDGVSHDFVPYQPLLRLLFEGLEREVTKQPKPEEILLNKVLTYSKRGSFDDRTLTLIYTKIFNL